MKKQKVSTMMVKNEELQQKTLQGTVLSEQKPQGFAGPASWSQGTSGTEMVTWQDDDGWYGCLQGQHQGNWFEGDDQGPFETREEVEQELRDQYEQSNETVEDYSLLYESTEGNND